MARISTWLVAVAALCWGLSAGIGGILLADGWDALVVAFYRGLVGLVFVLVWLIVSPRGSGLTHRQLWFWSVVAGFGVAGNFAFYFTSIAEGSVAVAATLMYCAPVFVYMTSLAFNLERPTPLAWAVMGVVLVGMVLLTRIHDLQAGGITPVGVGAGLLSGVAYAVFIFGFKYAAPHGSPQAILVIAFATFVALLAGIVDTEQAVAAMNSLNGPLFVLLGVLGAGVSFILYVAGLRHTSPVMASMVAMVEPVAASLFGVVVLSERLDGLQLFGMGLMLIAVTVLSVKSNARRVQDG